MDPEVCRPLREAAERLLIAEPDLGLEKLRRRLGLPGCRLPTAGDEPTLGEAKLLQLRNSICLEAAQNVSMALKSRTVGHFFAKGIALIDSGVYGMSDRSLSDIDLYVRPCDCAAAVVELEALGYRMLPETEQVGPPELRSALALESTGGVAIERVQVDLHRALDPLDRLLPRNVPGISDAFIGATVTSGSLPVPALEHHCFILVHQLVHTDMLQLHTLVDLANIVPGLSEAGARELWRLCRRFRIAGFLGWLVELLESEFGVSWPAKQERPASKRPFPGLVQWMRLVVEAPDDELTMITPARIKRRIELLDGGFSRLAVLGDVLFPPVEFLRWRRGTHILPAYGAHLVQVAKKALHR